MSQTRNGIVMVVAGLSVAAMTGALMKLLAGAMDPVQVTWFRFAGFSILLMPLVLWRFGLSSLKPARPGLQIVRGISMAAGTVCFVIGAQTVDFADAIAILYAYPFVLTVLAILFLGERVTAVGWAGVIGGFAGVLLVMRPEFGELNSGTLFIFACALIVGGQLALNRKLGSLSHPLVISLWGAVIAMLCLSVALPWVWQPISAEQWPLLLLMTFCGAVNQLLIVYGFARVEASILAPFTYFEIVAAVVCGFFIFGTLPDVLSWAGIALIVASGLVVAWSVSASPLTTGKPKY